MLYLDSRDRGMLGSASITSALETLGGEAALAIENARLYREALEKAKFEQELKVAAAFRQALLPVPSRTGAFFTTAATSIPCRAIGGDFFDYAQLATGQFGFIIGDVTGKGAAAALLAAAMLGMFSAEATHRQSAASLIAELNRGLFSRTIEARFLTAFYGVLSRDGSLTYSNAGHNAPVLLTQTGIRRLDKGGVVLGVFEDAAFEQGGRGIYRRAIRPGGGAASRRESANDCRRGRGRRPRLLRRCHAGRRPHHCRRALRRIDPPEKRRTRPFLSASLPVSRQRHTIPAKSLDYHEEPSVGVSAS